MYEVHYTHLVRLREEFRKLQSVNLRNYKLGQMILHSNACGIDLVAFLHEAEAPKSKKAPMLLQKQQPCTNQKLKCPYCVAMFDNTKQLAGHLKKHSPKYQAFNIKTNHHEEELFTNAR